jgi:hypothetical protein
MEGEGGGTKGGRQEGQGNEGTYARGGDDVRD